MAGLPPASSLSSAVSAFAVAYDTADDEATRVAASKSSGLETGFQAIANKEPSIESAATPADEWFVGINGAPIGPIRLSELRARAAAGSVTLETLVWRDGYEEWRPLKTFPELVAIVEEGLSSVRASLAPLPQPGGPSAPSQAPTPPVPSDSKPVSASNEMPVPVVAEKLASPSPGVTGSALVTDELPVRRQGSPVVTWVAIAVALALGLTLGFVLFSPSGETAAVTAPTNSSPAAAAVPTLEEPVPAPPPLATNAEVEAQPEPKASAAAPKSGGPVAAVAPKSTAAATDTKSSGGGLSGLKGLSGLSAGGPSGPSGGSAPSSGGSQLDGAQIQSTVARYTGSVKRSCWQPALDARDPNAPTSARVNVTITVGPSGSVQNVTTSGDPRGYPGLANCIAARVRAWQFPASGGTTTANIPFVFAAQ